MEHRGQCLSLEMPTSPSVYSWTQTQLEKVLGLPPASAAPWGSEHTTGVTANTAGKAPPLHLPFSETPALLLYSGFQVGWETRYASGLAAPCPG